MDYAKEVRRVAVIIEDDPDVRNLLEEILVQAGFETITTANGADGIRAVQEHGPSIITLDVNMPGMDGFETAKRIRRFSPCYLIMISGRDEEFDTLQGLQSGADDYIAKPFRPRELRARIDALLRRPLRDEIPDDVARDANANRGIIEAVPMFAPHDQSQKATGHIVVESRGADTAIYPIMTIAAATVVTPTTAQTDGAFVAGAIADAALGVAADSLSLTINPLPSDWFTHNGLQLSSVRRQVLLNAVEVDLTRTEFDLLSALLQSGGRVRSKSDLTLWLHGESYVTSYFVSDADKRAIEAHMGNLRRKLDDDSANPRWIETVRGVGYRLAAVGVR